MLFRLLNIYLHPYFQEQLFSNYSFQMYAKQYSSCNFPSIVNNLWCISSFFIFIDLVKVFICWKQWISLLRFVWFGDVYSFALCFLLQFPCSFPASKVSTPSTSAHHQLHELSILVQYLSLWLYHVSILVSLTVKIRTNSEGCKTASVNTILSPFNLIPFVFFTFPLLENLNIN